jgi:hypothetical protein
MKGKLTIRGSLISKSVAKRLESQMGKDSPRFKEMEIESRQRKRLNDILGNRKSSIPSADSDLIAASWEDTYGAIREQESFDSNKNSPWEEKERDYLKKLLIDAGIQIVRLREAIEEYIESPMVFHTVLDQRDLKEFYKRTKVLVDALGKGSDNV